MRRLGLTRAGAAGLAAALLLLLTGCGGAPSASPAGHAASNGRAGPAAPPQRTRAIPDVGARLRAQIPASARQVVAVYGRGAGSADATVVLFRRSGGAWVREKSWAAHNGRRGWTAHHREGDKKSPVGVFSLTDAGGVLPDPGAKLPYHASSLFTPPSYWSPSMRHDFDHVIAINYNRIQGTSPLDPQRPRGQGAGGGIWLHMDHGGGTSACISVSKSAMEYLLRTLDPERHPVIVMGDRRALGA